jgi:hypothetical protein
MDGLVSLFDPCLLPIDASRAKLARRALSKTDAMRLIGNSVPKRMARLLAEVNAAHALYVAPSRAVAA